LIPVPPAPPVSSPLVSTPESFVFFFFLQLPESFPHWFAGGSSLWIDFVFSISLCALASGGNVFAVLIFCPRRYPRIGFASFLLILLVTCRPPHPPGPFFLQTRSDCSSHSRAPFSVTGNNFLSVPGIVSHNRLAFISGELRSSLFHPHTNRSPPSPGVFFAYNFLIFPQVILSLLASFVGPPACFSESLIPLHSPLPASDFP